MIESMEGYCKQLKALIAIVVKVVYKTCTVLCKQQTETVSLTYY